MVIPRAMFESLVLSPAVLRPSHALAAAWAACRPPELTVVLTAPVAHPFTKPLPNATAHLAAETMLLAIPATTRARRASLVAAVAAAARAVTLQVLEFLPQFFDPGGPAVIVLAPATLWAATIAVLPTLARAAVTGSIRGAGPAIALAADVAIRRTRAFHSFTGRGLERPLSAHRGHHQTRDRKQREQ
ncbi:MAG: hypothetical protein ACT4PL_12705 [Phycisphaerales bacterium]